MSWKGNVEDDWLQLKDIGFQNSIMSDFRLQRKRRKYTVEMTLYGIFCKAPDFTILFLLSMLSG